MQQELQVPPGSPSSPTHPAPIMPRPSQQALLCLAVSPPELTWPWMWPCAHRQRTTSLLYHLQETGSLLWHQCPLGSRRWPEEPWAHCTALVQFTLIFYCSFQEEPLPNTLAHAFPNMSGVLFPSLNKITSTWKTSILHPWTIPKQLKAGDWAKLFPCLRSWMPGSETCHCYIRIKTSEDLEFYCQVPKKFSV